MRSQKKYKPEGNGLPSFRQSHKRVVVKVGSSIFAAGNHKPDTALLGNIAKQICALIKSGHEVVLVSSGAIAIGMKILKMSNRPGELAYLQATAAVGQHELMHIYKLALNRCGINCAQLLLTWDDFKGKRYQNAKNTLNTLLKLKSVPIINENDTVATEEIKFGDNDKLSALVSVLVDADLLIILSDVDGLLGKNKKVVCLVPKITESIKSLACSTNKKTCVGGMITKIQAAQIAQDSGIPCVIANGRKKDIIVQLAKNPFSSGTIFLPQSRVRH